MAEKGMRSSAPQRMAGRAAFTITLCLLAMGFMSCGTIRGLHKPQPVTFTSPEPGVEFEIYNGAGKLVFAGKTPTQVMLKAAKSAVSERYYVKSGGRIEVFQGDFSFPTLGMDVWLAIPTMFMSYFVDAFGGALHTLPSEQEIGNIYLNTPARLIGKIGGGE